ncbi:VRR-NUC domain-containing protein [Vibrio sp. CAU 1672]|uniref:VRR-NUC domain-containing protein n=1 Tax=Vibrio sp. CAU 1672 TaxID=3032594 RepID=UPI0023DB38B9|nr:VRR-NUC domain-containing protein [Vibrio sp. CAU 1672]MDF2155414.1 VRR-NUC domain-containing protein [Vibrio sp. CAU 1672]
METSAELAPDYYLTNFYKLIEHATQWYEDLLSSQEHQWLADFSRLPHSAQCLLVRLYSRKGCWFRSDKLNYPEISSIEQALAKLYQSGFITLNPCLPIPQLANSLLTKAEILALWPGLPKTQKKDLLIEQLEHGEFHQFERLSFKIIRLESAQMIDLLLTLFFANTRQDLSQFVLDDLGLQQFENYSLSQARRFFDNRSQVQHLITLSLLTEQYWQTDRKQKANLDALAGELTGAVGHHYVDRKREHLINDIARDYERLEEWNTALYWFEQTTLTPSRERRARIYDKLDQNQKFSDVVTGMLTCPIDDSELEIAQKLQQRLQRKQGMKIPRTARPEFTTHNLVLDLTQQRVELAVKSYFEQQGWSVFYTENTLLNALFGLTLWDAIFAPVEGAFINAYQHRPLDLYHSDFVNKRSAKIESALHHLAAGEYHHLYRTYQTKLGLSNPFIQWAKIEPQLLKLTLDTIPSRLLVALIRTQLRDLKLYRNGMPDLIAFKGNKFEWIEVKGPGDKLQDNQLRWFKQFQRLNVPFSVCYVEHTV